MSSGIPVLSNFFAPPFSVYFISSLGLSHSDDKITAIIIGSHPQVTRFRDTKSLFLLCNSFYSERKKFSPKASQQTLPQNPLARNGSYTGSCIKQSLARERAPILT
jgi:hypothetical protein